MDAKKSLLFVALFVLTLGLGACNQQAAVQESVSEDAMMEKEDEAMEKEEVMEKEDEAMEKEDAMMEK